MAGHSPSRDNRCMDAASRTSPPRGDGPRVPQVALTVSAVARRLGVAPATLRTWDRRYGLGPTGHAAGTHRRYTPDDVARLTLMRRLTLDGVAPVDAAKAALASDEAGEVTPLPVAWHAGGWRRGTPSAVPTAPVPTTAHVRSSEQVVRRRGGGRVIALPHATPAARGLARAAMALDALECTRIVRDQVRRRGVVPAWDDLVAPVLVGIGDRWEATGEGVEVEHLLSEAVLTAMRGTALAVGEAVNARPVLLACAEDELHSLPIHVLAAALAERHVASRMLGARVPGEALQDAVRRLGPLAVFVWSQAPRTARPAQLAHLGGMRPAPFLLAGGPGWDSCELPAGVARVTELAEAVERLVTVAGA